MPNNKGNIVLPIISAIAVLALIAAGLFFYIKTHMPLTGDEPAWKLMEENSKLFSQTAPSTPTSITQNETANWKTYVSKRAYSLKYPPEWTVEEFSGTIPGLKEEAAYVSFYSPKKEYALTFGIKVPDEQIRLSPRTGTGAGDFVPGKPITINDLDIKIPVRNLVYNDKIKTVFYQDKEGYFYINTVEAAASFDKLAYDVYENIDLKNSPELKVANQILSTFHFSK